MLDGRSEPLKKTESDILQINVTNSLLTDNKECDSIFREIDCTGENNNFPENVCLHNITNNRKLTSQKNRTYAEAVSVYWWANMLSISRRLERVLQVREKIR